jgi:hypothetical protein
MTQVVECLPEFKPQYHQEVGEEEEKEEEEIKSKKIKKKK